MLATAHAPLSILERCTLRRLAEGWETKQIAAWRGASVRTVQNQVQAIHAKLNLSRTRPDCTDWALAHDQCCIRPWEFPEDASIRSSHSGGRS